MSQLQSWWICKQEKDWWLGFGSQVGHCAICTQWCTPDAVGSHDTIHIPMLKRHERLMQPCCLHSMVTLGSVRESNKEHESTPASLVSGIGLLKATILFARRHILNVFFCYASGQTRCPWFHACYQELIEEPSLQSNTLSAASISICTVQQHTKTCKLLLAVATFANASVTMYLFWNDSTWSKKSPRDAIRPPKWIH